MTPTIPTPVAVVTDPAARERRRVTSSAARLIAVLCATLGGAQLLSSCGVDLGGGDDTFSCSGGSDPWLRCHASRQYCEQATDGSTSTGARCVSFPVSCVDDPCGSCLLRGYNGILGCSSSGLGTSRATTVTVRR